MHLGAASCATAGGIATDLARALTGVPNHIKLRIPASFGKAVRLRVLRSVVERERAQIVV